MRRQSFKSVGRATLLAALVVISAACGGANGPVENAASEIAGPPTDRFGPCSLTTDEFEAGVAAFEPAALECALAELLQGRDWSTLGHEVQGQAAPLMARLYLATLDPSLQAYDFCAVSWEVLSETIVDIAIIETGGVEGLPDAPFDVLEAFFDCTESDVVRAKPAVVRDPAFAEAVELYDAWAGPCDMTDPELRAAIEAGVHLFGLDAVECALETGLAGRRWSEVPAAEQAELAPLVAVMYGLTGERRWFDYSPCALPFSPVRFSLMADTSEALDEAVTQADLHDRRISQPDAGRMHWNALSMLALTGATGTR